jgi:hypothetical protein
MALLNSFGWLAAALLVGLISIPFGRLALRGIGVTIPGALERVLLSAGISFAILQIVVYAMLAEGWLHRSTMCIVLGAMALAGCREWEIFRELFRGAREFYFETRKTRLSSAVVLAILAVLVLDGLMAMAPLTGSDALHYHFTVPMRWMHDGIAPLYDIITSFGVGQAHMLIALGLALGSDHIALGIIFLGGVFSAASLYVLARRWMSFERSLMVTLVFLLSPMMFWQMAVGGSPDIWILFYANLAILAASRGITLRSLRWAAVAGFLAGAAGGSKYPALVIPATLVIVFLVECRSFWLAMTSSLAALAAGVWPLIRNARWTGDPFFPYASNLFKPHTMNTFTLARTLTDTHKGAEHQGFLDWVEYPFRMILDGNNFGVGHYFGPLVLILAPILLVAYRPTPVFRAAAWVWAAVFLSNQATSQMGRFLVPVFGIALAISFAGVESVSKLERPILRWVCSGSIALFLLFGAASFAAYGADFLPVSVGLESREHFLLRMSPNYQEVSFTNRVLEGKPGKTLVFFRLFYYLRVNYVMGDPSSNWHLYPEDFSTPQGMLKWLHANDVRWVVEVQEHPSSVRAALVGLETEGALLPVALSQAEDFIGWRIAGEKRQVSVRILEVRQPTP